MIEKEGDGRLEIAAASIRLDQQRPRRNNSRKSTAPAAARHRRPPPTAAGCRAASARARPGSFSS